MEKIDNAPKVRVGIIQSTDHVRFRCHGEFNVYNAENDILFSGTSDQPYELKMGSNGAAELIYQIRVALFKNENDAQKYASEHKVDGQPTEIRKFGTQLTFGTQIFDNSDYWVTVGSFSSHAEAISFRDESGLPPDLPIVEKIMKPATGSILYKNQQFGNRLRIIPVNPETLIEVADVPIGIEFHWQRKETLDYHGIIEIGFNNDGQLVVINEVNIEDYLASVNSSEMTPDCPPALLEAQTIAARSTVFATMGKHHYNTDFHLCSDDHCQCYQGAKREQQPSRQAIDTTFGETLISGDEICDARYSKICGGIIESYDKVWDERQVPYLVAGIDSDKEIDYPAETEEAARKLIDGEPDVFCNTHIYKLPEKLAGLYGTKDLFRWTVSFERAELQKLITRKLTTDFGELIDLKPVNRGPSGRIIYMDVIGSGRTIRVGKELAIRRILSESHLYSSCFYIEREYSETGAVNRFILKGAGWGHGVGLCQVGATVMALKGYNYKQILEHYFKNSRLEKLY